jgi:hypothetical protein
MLLTKGYTNHRIVKNTQTGINQKEYFSALQNSKYYENKKLKKSGEGYYYRILLNLD